MLAFASFMPHPPIIIPEIGRQDIKQAQNTINSFLYLSLLFSKLKPDIVYIISPHSPIFHNKIAVSYADILKGDLNQFNAKDIKFEFKSDKKFVKNMIDRAFDYKIILEGYADINENNQDIVYLDHGSMVPLYYLSKTYQDFELITSSFSDFSIDKHFLYGEFLYDMILESNKKIAIIASGDMSHTLKTDGPYGYNKIGRKFDDFVLEKLKTNDIESIKNMDREILANASECGYRSLLILLGILSKTKFKTEILSYEYPWGVGYLTANFLPKKKI